MAHETTRNMIPLTDGAIREYGALIARTMAKPRLSKADKDDVKLWAARIEYTMVRRAER